MKKRLPLTSTLMPMAVRRSRNFGLTVLIILGLVALSSLKLR